VLAIVQRSLDALLSVASPPACVACSQSARTPLCAACRALLELAEARSVVGVPIVAAALYAAPLDRAIQRFKYESRPDLARGLATLIAPLSPIDAEVLVPVPLHPNRLAERGYNQSALLALALSPTLRIPEDTRCLLRERDTPRQAELGKLARQANTEGAFRVRDRARASGRRIAIVDDVVTTGATVAACVKTLREAGAVVSVVLAVASAAT
jgi:ComF family protein